MMSAQEVFDTVVKHLYAQGHRAGKETSYGFTCKYLAPDGSKCAVGCLIPDNAYDKDMETQNATDIIRHFPKLGHLYDHQDLLNTLQDVHDYQDNWAEYQHPNSMTNEMRSALREVADSYNVSTGVLDSLT